MSSTVTTTTVTTVTSVTSTTTAVALSLSLALGLVLILTLLIFLIQKEVLMTSSGPRAQTMSRVLNVAIVPLMMSFFFIAAFNIMQVLR